MSRRIKVFLLSAIAIIIAVLVFIYFAEKVHPLMSNQFIYWSNEWQTIRKSNIIEKKTITSGSELDFDFIHVSEIKITGVTTNTDDDTSVVAYIDKKGTLVTVSELKKGKIILGVSDNKKHSFRLIFYCRGYNPCNFTLTDLFIKGGSILKPHIAPLKTIGIVGDSISLLYANNNYSSILSRNISYHLHNASIWGRDLSHTGKRFPAVELIAKDVLPYKPDIVIISLGTNDILDSVKENDFINDYKEIINQIKSGLPRAKIIVLSIMPGKTHQLEGTTKLWNTDMQKLFTDDVIFIDIINLLRPADYLDAIHANLQGQKKLADFLTKY
ncbi:MAG: SGNH/GDSL hydrolase family protein, partial [Nitrosotalea sp.]